MIGQIVSKLRLLAVFVGRDIREGYAGSVLGSFWAIIEPMIMVMMFWLVFANILKIKLPLADIDLPYIVFLLSGLLPFFAFTESISKASTSIIANRVVVKKVLFPLEIFVLSAVVGAHIKYALIVVCGMLIFLVWRHSFELFPFFAVIVTYLSQTVLAAAIGLVFSSVAVYVPDVNQMLRVITMAMLYTAPVLYPETLIPESLLVVAQLNPFTGFAGVYHAFVFESDMPLLSIGVHTGVSFSLFFLALAVFKRLRHGFADVM